VTTEYGLSLLEVVDTSRANVEVRIDGPDRALQKMSEEQSYQITLFSNGADGIDFREGVVWGRRGCWQTKTIPIGKFLTPTDAELFGISTAAKEAGPILQKTGHQRTEMVSGSREALTAISHASRWAPPLVKKIKHHAEHLRLEGYSLMLSWLPSGEEI
jgi:hypothetical protein